jgi:sortase A
MSAKHSSKLSHRFLTLRLAIGVSLLILAVLGATYPLWWANRSNSGAQRLLKSQDKQLVISLKNTYKGKSCSAKPGPGVLNIPSLGLIAPVEQGLSNSVLNVSIGHDPSTPWPGPNSATLLAAHDVSFFSQLNRLPLGSVVTYTVPCATYEFKVTAAVVSAPGKQIHVPSSGAIVMDTCWPPNALFFTPDRYIVTASYVKTLPQDPAAITLSSKLNKSIDLSVNDPAGLPFSALELQNNTQPLGLMSFSGSPSKAFIQSDEPLQLDGVALEGWFVALHAITSNQSSWWSEVAPGVSFPKALVGKEVRQDAPLYVNEDVRGMTPVSVTLTGNLDGQNVKVTETVSGKKLFIATFLLGG